MMISYSILIQLSFKIMLIIKKFSHMFNFNNLNCWNLIKSSASLFLSYVSLIWSGFLLGLPLSKVPKIKSTKYKNSTNLSLKIINYKTIILIINIGSQYLLVISYSTLIFPIFIKEIEHFLKSEEPLISDPFYLLN